MDFDDFVDKVFELNDGSGRFVVEVGAQIVQVLGEVGLELAVLHVDLRGPLARG